MKKGFSLTFSDIQYRLQGLAVLVGDGSMRIWVTRPKRKRHVDRLLDQYCTQVWAWFEHGLQNSSLAMAKVIF